MTSPANWGIVGHEWAVTLLEEKISSGREGHAILITGSSGLGKGLLALRLAQAFNCIGSRRPCLACRPCTFTEAGKHVDCLSLESTAKTIKIEEVREMASFVSMKPFEARNRVILIRDFDRATGPAMDALLKTLEEPGPTSKIILTAETTQSLLPTIVSRCQVYQLRPLSVQRVEQALLDEGVHQDTASLIASLSGGRIGWAIEMARNPSALGWRAEKIAPVTRLPWLSRVQRFTLAEEIVKGTNDQELPILLSHWLTFWRDVLLASEQSPLTPVNWDMIQAITTAASHVTPPDILHIIDVLNETMKLLGSTNTNKRLALEVMM